MTSARRQKTPEEINLYIRESDKYDAMREAKDPSIKFVVRNDANGTFKIRMKGRKILGTSRTVDGAIRLAEAAMACINDITG